MAGIYNNAKGEFQKGNLAWVSGTFKVMLVTSGYTFDPDHVFVSSADASELSGTGYAGGFGGSGRKSLASKTVTVDNTNDRAAAGAANVTWTAINAGTPVAAIVIKEVTTDADSLLIAYLDFASIVTNGGDLSIVWDAIGLFYLG